jgi:hypothetical protein
MTTADGTVDRGERDGGPRLHLSLGADTVRPMEERSRGLVCQDEAAMGEVRCKAGAVPQLYPDQVWF